MAAAAVALPRVALARRTARLDHGRDAGAEACPSDAALAARVAERLGYDPFRSGAAATVRVRFTRDGDLLRGVVEMRDARGPAGRRELSSDRPDCADLADSVALTVSILLDPPTVPGRDVPSATPPAPPPPEAPLHPGAPPPPLPDGPRTALRFGTGVSGAVGFAPGPTSGLYLAAGVLRGPWSLDLEGRIDLPAERGYEAGTVRASIRLGELVPCWHFGAPFACLVVGAGALSAEGRDVKSPRHVDTFYALAGARAGVEFALVGPVLARLSADVVASLTRPTVAIGNVDAWTVPPVGALVAAGLVGRFP